MRQDRTAQALASGGHVLIALWGWAALALASASLPPLVGAAVVGISASCAARRAPRGSAVVEVASLAAFVAYAPQSAVGFLLLGVGLVLVARAVSMWATWRAG